MADEDDVRRIAATLSEVTVALADTGQMKVDLRGKGLAWTWLERAEPKAPRLPNPGVLAVRTAGEEHKQELIADAWRIRAPKRLQKQFDL